MKETARLTAQQAEKGTFYHILSSRWEHRQPRSCSAGPPEAMSLQVENLPWGLVSLVTGFDPRSRKPRTEAC